LAIWSKVKVVLSTSQTAVALGIKSAGMKYPQFALERPLWGADKGFTANRGHVHPFSGIVPGGVFLDLENNFTHMRPTFHKAMGLIGLF
jgi:hypothetical protein